MRLKWLYFTTCFFLVQSFNEKIQDIYNNENVDAYSFHYLFNFFKQYKQNEDNIILDIATKIVRVALADVLENYTNHSISSECQNKIKESFELVSNDENYENTTLLNVQKLISDSTMNKNDLSSYQDCKRKNYGRKGDSQDTDHDYLLVQVELIRKIDSDETDPYNWYKFHRQGKYFFGICLPSKCNEDDYSKLASSIYESYLPEALKPDSSQYYALLKFSLITKKQAFSDFPVGLKRHFVPWCVFSTLVLLFIVPSKIILKPLALLCYKNKPPKKGVLLSHEDESRGSDTLSEGKNSIKESSQSTTLKRSIFFQVLDSLNSLKNSEELFNPNIVSSKINNDSGVTNIRGLRGLSIIFLFSGMTFFIFLNSSVSTHGAVSLKNILENILYPLFSVGYRYAPRILFSCSGYCLFYKLNCFLDDAFESEKEAKTQTIFENNEVEPEKILAFHNENDKSVTDDDGIENEAVSLKREVSDIPFRLLFKFYFYQIHKYLMYCFTIIFVRYALYYIVYCFSMETGAYWEYFRKFVIGESVNIKYLFSGFGLIYSFFFGPFSSEKYTPRHFYLTKENEDFFIGNYWIIENEFLFFIITSFFLFLGYKYKFNVVRFLNWICVLFILLKLGLFIESSSLESNRIVCNKPNFFSGFFNSSIYFFFLDFGNIFVAPYYNYIYFLIGVFFGSANYSLQKACTYEEANSKEKPFLFQGIKFTNIIKRFSRITIYAVGIILIILAILISYLQMIFELSFNDKEDHEQFCKKSEHSKNLQAGANRHVLNFIMHFDIEFVVISIHLVMISFYIKGTYFINKFLSSQGWSILNKLYFSIILILPMVILYVLYLSESRIAFNIGNCFIYSFISGFLTFVLSCIVYIFFELPYKRIVKLVIIGIKKQNEFDYYNNYKPLFRETK